MPEPALRRAFFPAPILLSALAAICLLSGCRHKPAPAPPPAAVAPPVTSSTVTVITPLPSLPPGTAPNVQQAPPPAAAAPPVEQKARRPRRLRRKATPPKTEVASANPTAANPAANTPAGSDAATSAATPGAPSLGELSAGTAISLDQRNRMLADIAKQEARLAKLPVSTVGDTSAIQTQIRTFLARARQAVAQNDLDGAETLNTKARVLLDELQGE